MITYLSETSAGGPVAGFGHSDNADSGVRVFTWRMLDRGSYVDLEFNVHDETGQPTANFLNCSFVPIEDGEWVVIAAFPESVSWFLEAIYEDEARRSVLEAMPGVKELFERGELATSGRGFEFQLVFVLGDSEEKRWVIATDRVSSGPRGAPDPGTSDVRKASLSAVIKAAEIHNMVETAYPYISRSWAAEGIAPMQPSGTGDIDKWLQRASNITGLLSFAMRFAG